MWEFSTRFRLCIHLNDPERASVASDCIYDGMLYGNNAKVIKFPDAMQLGRSDNFELTQESSASMHAIIMPSIPVKMTDIDDSEMMPFENDETMIFVNGGNQFDLHNGQGDYPGHAFYSIVYGFDKILLRNGADQYPIAPVAFKGHYQYQTEGGGIKEVVGHGHHGAYEGSGCRAVREKGLNVNRV
jgi:hypothetical protein